MKDITLRLEREILSAMTLDFNALEEGRNELLEKHFSLESHKVWFLSVLESAKTKEHSLFNVLNIIERDYNKSFENASVYILGCTDDLVSINSITGNIELLKKKYKQRFLSELFYTSFKALSDENQEVDDISYHVQTQILDLNKESTKGGLTNINQSLEEIYKEASFSSENPNYVPSNIIKTHFSSIDDKLIIKEEDLIVIGARPAMGKTSFLLNVGLNIVQKNNCSVAMFSLEMSSKQITKRLLALDSDISTNKMNFLDRNELEKLGNSIDKLKDINFFIDDKSAISPEYLRSQIRQLKTQGIKLGAVLVDYIQLMKLKGSKGNREQEIAEITRELKNIARDEKVPVITLAQLSRSVEQRANKRPQLSDLRESGEIEQSADVIGFLYRDEYYNKDSAFKKQAELIIAKYREGETGTINLFFDAMLTKFASLERGE